MDSREQFSAWADTLKEWPNDFEVWQASREALVVEPVVVVDKNSAGQINLKRPDGDSFDMSKHIGETLYRISP